MICRSFNISGQEMEDRSNDRSLSRILCSCLHHTIDNDTTDYSDLLQKAGSSSGSSNGGGGGGGVAAAGGGGSNGRSTKPSSGSTKCAAAASDGGPGSGPSSGDGGGSRSSKAAAVLQYGGCGYLQRVYRCSRLSQYAYMVFLIELSRLLVQRLMEQFIMTAHFSEWGALLLHQEVLSASSYLESLVDSVDARAVPALKDVLAPLLYAVKVLTLDAPSDIRRYRFPASVFSEEQVRKLMQRRVEFSKEAVAKVRINIDS